MPADASIHIQLTGKKQPEKQYLQQLPLNGYLPEMEVIPFLKNNNCLGFPDFPGRGATRERP